MTPHHAHTSKLVYACVVLLLSASFGLGMACSGNRGTESAQDLPSDFPSSSQTGISKSVLHVDTVDCGVFDPAIDLWDTGNGIGSPPLVPEIHAGLARFTDDNNRPVELELASSYEVSDDGRVYNFNLKPGIKFSDGRAVRAVDFKFSWTRALALGRPGGFAHSYLGGIHGADGIINAKATELEGVEVVDDQTFLVVLTEPDFSFLMRVAHPVSFVVYRENAELWDDVWTNDVDPYSMDAPDVQIGTNQLPAGTGPFRLLSFTSSRDDRLCVLARNEEYTGNAPRLEYVIISDASGSLAGFGDPLSAMGSLYESGEIDIDHSVLVRLTDEQLDDLANQRTLAPEVPTGVISSRTNVGLAVLALNPSSPHLNDPATRRAILSNADIVSEIYGSDFPSPNRIVPEILQSGLNGVEPVMSVVADTQILDDLAATQEILTIVDTTDSHRFNYQGYVANLTERWWRDFGVDFRVASASPMKLSAMLEKGEVDARMWQLTLQMPDPLEVLRLFDRPFGEMVTTDETDKLDRLFSSVAAARDGAERREGMTAIEDLILDSALGAVLHWDVGWIPVRVQPYVHGFTGATFPRSMFHSVWMDDSAPERPVP